MELTVPLTLGAHEVTWYGAVWLKLKMLFRVKILLPWRIEVKDPTAYMVPPQATSCLICWVVPVLWSAGVPVAGGHPGPFGGAATPDTKPEPPTASALRAATGALRSNQRPSPCIMPPFVSARPARP